MLMRGSHTCRANTGLVPSFGHLQEIHAYGQLALMPFKLEGLGDLTLLGHDPCWRAPKTILKVEVTGTVCSLWAMVWDAAAGGLRRYMQQVCCRSSGVGTVPSRLHIADGWPGKELQQQTADSGGGTHRHWLGRRCIAAS